MGTRIKRPIHLLTAPIPYGDLLAARKAGMVPNDSIADLRGAMARIGPLELLEMERTEAEYQHARALERENP